MCRDASKALGDDIDELGELYKSNSSPSVTRSLVRAYSAYIEASVFEMRQVALQRYRGNPELFSPEEESVLLEKSVFLDRKGKVQSKDDYQRFLPLVLFSIRAYARSYGANFEPDTGDHRWESFQHFVSFRNRLMHPKSLLDIEFDDDDLLKMMAALDWFHDTNMLMVDSIRRANNL
jgi:hypothetical protein